MYGASSERLDTRITLYTSDSCRTMRATATCGGRGGLGDSGEGERVWVRRWVGGRVGERRDSEGDSSRVGRGDQALGPALHWGPRCSAVLCCACYPDTTQAHQGAVGMHTKYLSRCWTPSKIIGIRDPPAAGRACRWPGPPPPQGWRGRARRAGPPRCPAGGRSCGRAAAG